jgi:Flp pilus assembly protein CpaB
LWPTGTVAGIPAGKRAFALDVDKVQGIVFLNPGDHFDLMAAWSVDVQKALTPPSGRAGTATSPSPELHAQVHSQPKRAGVKRLVHDGIVVSGPKQVSRSPRRTGGRPAPEREMMIAVNPDEVAPLLEALATDAEVSCVARSGRTDDPGTSVIPESNPVPPVRAIEQLLGNRRSTTAFPVQGAAPTPEK